MFYAALLLHMQLKAFGQFIPDVKFALYKNASVMDSSVIYC